LGARPRCVSWIIAAQPLFVQGIGQFADTKARPRFAIRAEDIVEKPAGLSRG